MMIAAGGDAAGAGDVHMLDEGGGMPLGLDPDAEYEDHREPLEPGGRVLVLSDGIVEQYGAAGASAVAGNQQFGIERVRGVLRATDQACDAVDALFDAVESHAGTSGFQDDATAVLVTWGG
jgi:sigma-B regulation protein RsbU (phosphoserine phosphatase)